MPTPVSLMMKSTNAFPVRLVSHDRSRTAPRSVSLMALFGQIEKDLVESSPICFKYNMV